MAQKKGQTGNPHGRKKGVPNKVTGELREVIKMFLESKFEEVVKVWQKANPKEKLTFFKDLMPFVIPRMQSVDLDMDLSSLSEEQLIFMCNELFKRDEEK
ncbi:MAG TPA: DUF5681 domain-containing protein [Ignavibacteria bacterium]